ncbi:hypothetical protein LTR85_002742 [Meristemomyces frigidus]|nr:hypothetical protein LTR85_002742 [Meristemomyces frigidus]
MASWHIMTAFELIGDLSSGEAFNSLRDRRVHEWIPVVSEPVRFFAMANVLRNDGLDNLTRYLIPKNVQLARVANYRYAQDQVGKRAASSAARGDFWDRIMIKSVGDNASGEGMSQGEMLNNATLLVLAGSETSATALSGATYLLLKHPGVMKKAVKEVRTAFEADGETTLFSVVSPGARLPPEGGATACGKFVPEGTTINISMLGANPAATNFHRPDDFVPERWLDDAPAEFANDNKAVFQPFGMGTRNCIGRNLAYAKMRLILAKVLWHFDLTLDEERTGDWFDQKAWLLWFKKPLYVKLSAAKRA